MHFTPEVSYSAYIIPEENLWYFLVMTIINLNKT